MTCCEEGDAMRSSVVALRPLTDSTYLLSSAFNSKVQLRGTHTSASGAEDLYVTSPLPRPLPPPPPLQLGMWDMRMRRKVRLFTEHVNDFRRCPFLLDHFESTVIAGDGSVV